MAEERKDNGLLKYMTNPRSFTLKRWFYELLKEKYAPHETIIERTSAALTTDKDVEDFGKLIMQVYEAAYHKAVDDYREQAAKMGLKVEVNQKKG